MGDTFHAIIVGECLPETRRGADVSDMGYVRPFEEGFSDADAILAHLSLSRRSALTRRGVWPVNMSPRPGGYRDERPTAVAKWRSDLAGPDNRGLFRATKRHIRVLCLSNWVAEDVSEAHGFTGPMPCISTGSSSATMDNGGTWQFATWFRKDMRAGKHADLVRDFLRI